MNKKLEDKKTRFMVTTRDLIVATKPELTGRFTTLHIWEDLAYYFRQNWTAEQAAAVILKTDYTTIIS